jgi:hypothetical protein
MSKELKSAVAELSEKLAQDIKIDATTGTPTIAEDIYDKNLPEGLTPAVVKQLHEHNSVFASAGVHRFGVEAVKALAENKTLDQVTGTVPFGHKDTLSITTSRSVTTGTGEKQRVDYGVTVGTITNKATHSAGQMKVALDIIGAAAAAALAPKD